MSSSFEITKESWVVLGPWGRKYITSERAQAVIQERKSGGAWQDTETGEYIETIWAVVKASTIESEDRRKKGDWKCDHGYWHSRNEKCGHVDAAFDQREEERIAEYLSYPVSGYDV